MIETLCELVLMIGGFLIFAYLGKINFKPSNLGEKDKKQFRQR